MIGVTKTCTVTNDDIQPKLIVIKHVINDNGGTKTAADFTMSVTGASVSPASFAGAESPGTTVALNAGTYSVAEAGLAGYTQADLGRLLRHDRQRRDEDLHDHQRRPAAALIVIKHVINDNGGTKPTRPTSR